jgi:hypothetical protein
MNWRDQAGFFLLTVGLGWAWKLIDPENFDRMSATVNALWPAFFILYVAFLFGPVVGAMLPGKRDRS